MVLRCGVVPVEYINKDVALKYLMGNERIFDKVKDSFLASYVNCDFDMNQLIQNHQPDELEIYIHSLKGIALNLGAEKLFNSAILALDSIKKGLWEESLFTDFHMVLIKTYNELKSL